MKYLLWLTILWSSQNLQGQNSIKMNTEINSIQQAISQLFVRTDNRDWAGVESQFADKVMLDYSSMSGSPAAELTPQEITGAWKTVLPGFDHTHHQIGNFIIDQNGDHAHAFCYGTATHYLEDEAGNVWTVVGSYDFDLSKIDGSWKVTAMTFNYKYQDGNTSLVQKAIERLK